MPRACQSAPTLALALGALALAGCGSGSSSTTTTSGQSAAATPAAKAAVKKAAAAVKAAESKAPKGASPTLLQIYRQFPAPQADPKVRRSAAAIKAGEKACAAKTPLQVKEAFYPVAIAKGGLEEGGEQAKMIAATGKYEKNASKDASFTAGQLAADAYEATLPEAIGQYGYQGCVYALARRLEGELRQG